SVPCGGGEEGGADGADPGVQDRVEQPSHENAVVLGQRVVDVAEQLRGAGEPEPEGVDQVRGALGGGDHQPEERDEEVGECGEHRDGQRGAATGEPVAAALLARPGVDGRHAFLLRFATYRNTSETITMTSPRRNETAAA